LIKPQNPKTPKPQNPKTSKPQNPKTPKPPKPQNPKTSKPQIPKTPEPQNSKTSNPYLILLPQFTFPILFQLFKFQQEAPLTVLVVSPAALLNSNSASSTLNVNLFLYLAAIEAIANMQYLIREVSKSQPTNNDDRYRTGKNSFIFIAVNSCVNILFALCGTHTIKNISLHIQYCFSSSNFNKKLLNCVGCIFSSSPKFA
jgi:hypothetical protein